MNPTIRISIFDPQNGGAGPIRESLAEARDVRIAGKFTDWSALQLALSAQDMDAVAVNLDSLSDSGWTVISQIAELAPKCRVLGFSADCDSQRILAAMRAGCHQFVPVPVEPHDLEAALASIHRVISEGTSEGFCIGAIGAAGGAGTTTVICNLAVELAALTHRRCAVVDMNLLFGDVSNVFDARPTYSIADVCRVGNEVDQGVIQNALHALSDDIALLARPEGFNDLAEITHERIERTFATLRKMFAYVVVDFPRDFSSPILAALGATDRLLIVTQLSVPHLRNAVRITQQLGHLGAAVEGLEFVINRANSTHEHINLKEAEKHLGRPCIGVVPNDYRRVRASHDLGQTASTDLANSPIRQAIRGIAQSLAGRNVVQPEGGGGSGFFGSLLGRRSKLKKVAK